MFCGWGIVGPLVYTQRALKGAFPFERNPYGLVCTGMGAAAPNPGHTFSAERKYAKIGKGAALDPCSGRALRAKPGKGHSPLTPQPDGSGRSNVRPDLCSAYGGPVLGRPSVVRMTTPITGAILSSDGNASHLRCHPERSTKCAVEGSFSVASCAWKRSLDWPRVPCELLAFRRVGIGMTGCGDVGVV